MTAPTRSWIRRSTLVALARVANTIFFLLTSSYCLLTYSSFAYQQFVRPHLINWLTGFVVWHHVVFWLMLLVTALTVWPDLDRRSAWTGPSARAGRTLGWGYLAASTLVGIALLVRPVLPQVENNGPGLALALAALVPPIWLAVFDHYRYRPVSPPAPSLEGRVCGGALVACAALWIGQAVAIPWRWNQTGEIGLASGAIAFGAATSAVVHLLVFAVLGFLMLTVMRAGRWSRRRGQAEYWLIAAMAAVGLAMIVNRQVFAAIAFTGRAAWALSIVVAVMLALVWSGIGRLVQSDSGPRPTSVEAWLAPVPGVQSRMFSISALAALVFIEIGLIAFVTTVDWDFVLQKLCVLAVWFLAFAYGFGAMPGTTRPRGWISIATPALAGVALFAGSQLAQSRLPDWIGDPTFVPEFVLEGYVAVDPSYRVIHDALRVTSREDTEFYAYLRAHSMIQHVSVAPIDVDFVPPKILQRHQARQLTADTDRKPNIFLFVIDSLRRDYLSPYNPAVRFTPAIGELAKDSVVFERAFTRYGGTGLSVPAIWAGGMLLHKQYVTPFGPMNALLKMLEADSYRRVMSMDSIVVQLMPAPPPADELDRGVPIMSYRLCQTLEDLKGKLAAGAGKPLRSGDERPVFAYSLPQDIHISHIRKRPVPAAASYPGFFPPVAAQVEEMDGCFGRFVAFLKQSGLYDHSVIVITSDHGDSLGEGTRWGHSYTMFQEVARVPLIVHVPERFRNTLVADAGAVSLSTDLTPTLYALAGHTPKDLGPLYGRPLFVPRDSDQSARRQEPRLIASSYGAVYAVLRENGSRLFIADGVNGRDYAYELGAVSATRVGITAAERRANRRFIRQQIADIARLYRFVPQP